MGTDTITVIGTIATNLRCITTSDGLAITSFRLASEGRRYDPGSRDWRSTGTNWFTVTAFRSLADHAGKSLSKGQRVIVQGRLRIRDWESEEKSGTNVEIQADAIGHDLLWGTSVFTKHVKAAPTAEVAATGVGPGDTGAGAAAAPSDAASDVTGQHIDNRQLAVESGDAGGGGGYRGRPEAWPGGAAQGPTPVPTPIPSEPRPNGPQGPDEPEPQRIAASWSSDAMGMPSAEHGAVATMTR